ncbi:MAG: dimethylamine monooxygenase subunit DmmA family protein [Yoonia sp.]|uniref:dimethylamine monooxygenase subunit DmmA family protein n=1 Tax=Yoonia sp. TaxID=2212373 RepID=UPI003EF6776B
MSKFEFPPSIGSRPIWGSLEPRIGATHLFIADAQGAEAIIDVATPELMKTGHIIFISRGTDYSDKLRALDPAQFYEGPSYSASLPRIKRVLSDAKMGIQVYLSGTESLMGQATNEATSAGVPSAAIQTEHRGSTARRMQCVHCKGFTEDVETDPFVCSHCGLNLFVRDHYSRRLAAYQGVCVDAEDPGNVPAQKGIYE